jgi:hypothetical protein
MVKGYATGATSATAEVLADKTLHQHNLQSSPLVRVALIRTHDVKIQLVLGSMTKMSENAQTN